MVNKVMLRSHPYILASNQRMMAGNSTHLLQVNIFFVMKGEMKWYIAKLAKVQMTLNAVFKMSTKKQKTKTNKREDKAPQLPYPLLSPPYSFSFVWHFVPMGFVTFLVVSNDLFHPAKEESPLFFICIYSSSLLMHLVNARKTCCDYFFWFSVMFPFVKELFYAGN